MTVADMAAFLIGPGKLKAGAFREGFGAHPRYRHRLLGYAQAMDFPIQPASYDRAFAN